MIKFICPICSGELEEISEHLEATNTQPEFLSQFWCLDCQEYLTENEIERTDTNF